MTIRGVVFPGAIGTIPTEFPGLMVYRNAAYNSTDGHGWASGGQSGAANNGAMPDDRLAGHVLITSGSAYYRVDYPNGDYIAYVAAGHVGTSARATVGVNDLSLDSVSAIDPTSVVDAGNNVITVDAWAASNGGQGGGAGVPITITDGILYVYKDAFAAYPRVVWLVPVSTPPADAVIPTDDQGIVVTTTGNTTSGSHNIASLGDVAGVYAGMNVKGPGIPAGATVKSMDFGGSALVLDDAHTASATASGVSLTFYYAPKFFEKSPPDKVVGPIYISSGPGAAADLAICFDDGVTPCPFLKIRTRTDALYTASTTFLAYTSLPLPGSFDGKFTVVQNLGGGSFYTTHFELPVVACPGKPVDFSPAALMTTAGSYAVLSTGAYLAMTQADVQIALEAWAGYREQTLYAAAFTAYSLADLFGQIGSLPAGAGRWFKALLSADSTAAAAASKTVDWATNYINTTFVMDFFAQSGGGLVVENAPGQSPLIHGQIYFGALNGAEWRNGIRLATIGSGAAMTFRAGGDTTHTVRNTIRITACKIGILHDPSYDPDDYTAWIPVAARGICVQGGGQIIVEHCDFYGSEIAIICVGLRLVVSRNNRFRRMFEDCHRVGIVDPDSAFIGMWPAGDKDCYVLIEDADGYAVADDVTGAHGDGVQLQTANYDNPGTLHIIMRRVRFTQAMTATDGIGGSPGRNGFIATDGAPCRTVFFNCLVEINPVNAYGATNGEFWIEYCTAGGISQFPNAAPGGNIVSQGRVIRNRSLVQPASPMQIRSRKNLVHSITASVGGDASGGPLASEDDILVDFASPGAGGATDPNTVFHGTFTADAYGRMVHAIDESVSVAKNDHAKAVMDIYRPRVDAGMQCVALYTGPSDVEVVLKAEFSAMEAVTEGQPVGVGQVGAAISFKDGAGETGTIQTVPLTYNVA